MDKLEVAVEVVQYLDVPLVVKRARRHLRWRQTRLLPLERQQLQIDQALERIYLQAPQPEQELPQELRQERHELFSQSARVLGVRQHLQLMYRLPDDDRVGLGFLGRRRRTMPHDNSDDDDCNDGEQLLQANSVFWEEDDIFIVNTIESARRTIVHEGNADTPSTAMGDPCICGQCGAGNCGARMNLLRWAIARIPERNLQLTLSRILRVEHVLASSIIGNSEDRGLAYLESVLPFDLPKSQEQEVCLTCNGLGTSLGDPATSFKKSTVIMPLYRIKAAARLCAFCRLLCRATGELVRPSHLYSFRSSIYTIRFQAVNCILRTTPTSSTKQFKKRMWGEKFVSVEFDPAPFPLQKDARSLVLHSIALSIPAKSFTSGRIAPETQIDLPLLESWLSECVATHGDACNAYHLPNADGKLHNLRVVDVSEYRIIRQASALRYIALSYVWGQTATLQLTRANESELCRPGALLNHISGIPQTILDAFEAVKAMGEKYLWVDALCIIQDAGDKETHLQEMHLVYGAALLTIVAGHGNDANAGLPGIRPSSRIQSQQFEEICPGVGAAVSLPLPDAINSSRWSSRAWTYQEQLLSRRFLVFVGEQVIWQCPSEVNCEDTLADNKTKVYQRLKHMSAPVDTPTYAESDRQLEVRYGFRRPPAFQRYADVIAEYTGRQLTFSEDILRAFSGLSMIFMLDLNTELTEGLPLSYLDAALLWQPRHQLCRRKGTESFASWSWAGWEGKVGYEDITARNNVEGVIPLVKWNLHHSVLVNTSGVGTKPYLLDSESAVSTWDMPFEPSVNDIMESLRNPVNTSRLKFWTSCAFFKSLVARRKYEIPLSHTTDLSKTIPMQFQVRSSSSQPIGILTMTGSAPVKLDPSRHEYIVISGAQFAGIDLVSWLPKFSPEQSGFMMYNVMLVEWDVEKSCAYRVGLGRIMKSAWMQAKPCNKQITLG